MHLLSFQDTFYCDGDGNLIGEVSSQNGKMRERRDNYSQILQESFDLKGERVK